MTYIVFPKDLDGSENKAYQFMNELWDRSELPKEHPIYIDPMLPTFIQQGLEILESSDEFPVGKYDFFFGTLVYDDGRERIQELVKPLAVQPIYELRIDWNSNCHFRAIYFPFNLEGQCFYCFTHAFIKTRNYDKTNEYRDKARKIYERIRKNPNELRELINEKMSE